jgi:hypothetical protein
MCMEHRSCSPMVQLLAHNSEDKPGQEAVLASGGLARQAIRVRSSRSLTHGIRAHREVLDMVREQQILAGSGGGDRRLAGRRWPGRVQRSRSVALR